MEWLFLGILHGLINVLSSILIIIPIIAIISLLYCIVQIKNKKVKLKELFTLPIVVYLACVIALMILSRKFALYEYDEYFFWGTNLKVMCLKDLLWAHESIDGIHLVYPPFTAVAEYIVCKFNGGFSENAACFTMTLLIATAIMPVLKNENYSIKSFIKTIIVFILTYVSICLFEYNIATLQVDCLLGVLFAVAVYQALNINGKKDYFALIILLITLTSVKTNGILFAGIVIMQRFFIELFGIIKNKEKNIKCIFKKARTIILMLAVIIATYEVWNLYCYINGKEVDIQHDMNTTDNIDIIEFINDITMSENANERNITIVRRFIEKLFNNKVIEKNSCNTTMLVLLIINILLILQIILKKEKSMQIATLISFDIGFILYCLMLLVVFIFVFNDFLGDIQAGFERYIKTYLLAMALYTDFTIIKEMNGKTFAVVVAIIGTMLIGFTKDDLMLVNAQGANESNLEIKQYTISTETKNQSANLIENVDEDEKVYLIDERLNYGLEFVKMRYLIAPIKTNLLYEWNVSNDGAVIYYVLEISPEDLMNKLIDEDYDYVFFMYINSDFINQYKEILSDEILEWYYEENEEDVVSEIVQNGMIVKIDKENKKLVLNN